MNGNFPESPEYVKQYEYAYCDLQTDKQRIIMYSL